MIKTRCHFFVLLLVAMSGVALADSSSPKLAAYYDRHMAIVSGVGYAWTGRDPPAKVVIDVKQVGVGRDAYYALLKNGNLVLFQSPNDQHRVLMENVAKFSAGQSGVLVITTDHVLWWLDGATRKYVADDVATAAVGDGANYYVSTSGDLFVKGLAHRGQYGDGRLKSTKLFVKTASQVRYITAHTGHAILLRSDGSVWGTGGNIFGPVGKYGLGDKAVRWSRIVDGAKAIATGSFHSVAILETNALVAWGRGYEIEPKAILENVAAVAAGSRTTIALKMDGTLWQWGRGQRPRHLPLPN